MGQSGTTWRQSESQRGQGEHSAGSRVIPRSMRRNLEAIKVKRGGSIRVTVQTVGVTGGHEEQGWRLWGQAGINRDKFGRNQSHRVLNERGYQDSAVR